MLAATGRSSDSGLPLAPPSQPRPVACGARASPLTAAGPSRTCTGFPNRSPYVGAEPIIARVRRWVPVVAWAALIFVVSSIPSLSSGLGTWDLVLRKAAHIAEYAVLGALLVRALPRPALAVALGVAYAVTDEVHQSFVEGRTGSPVDVAVDAIGVFAGVLAYRRLRA